jgi:hypothetical protein
MSTTGNHTPERTLGQLVSDATADVSALVRNEIELATAEIKSDLTNAGKGAGFFVGAGVLAAYGFVLALLAGAWGLVAAGLPEWAGHLIVGAVLFLIAAILGFIGYRNVKKVEGKPKRAIAEAQRTVEAVKPTPQPRAGETAPVSATRPTTTR